MPSVDIGTESYPSFCDTETADTYLGGDVMRAGLWRIRPAATKARGLVSATRMLLRLPFCDAAPDPADGDIPAVLVEVTAELASDLIAKPKLFADASGNSNVKQVKAGSAQVEFFAPVEGGPPIPRAMWERLVAAQLVCVRSGADDDGSMVGALFSGTSSGCRPDQGRYGDYDREGWLAEDRD